MIKELINDRFRTDGVKIVIKTGESYMHCTTGQIVQELPEDAVLEEWAKVTTKLRSDQTGEEYDIVHDVEGSPNTYTEVYLSPESYCRTNISKGTTGNLGSVTYIKNAGPTYASATTYHKGDKVVYDKKTYICEEDEITGVLPKHWGFDLYLPYVERLEQKYITFEELPQPVAEGA